ncbi:FHA domain-containing protein [bacterium]|nr:FHA domain-containing protein [bacterium]NUN44539.1 FHA domain-containing protein [bacterium]
MASLVLIENNTTATRFRIEKDDAIIGRRPENDIMIANVMISGKHARVEKKNGLYQITDLGSTNGTFVNGTRVTGSAEIKNQDHINFGAVELIFMTDENAMVNIDRARFYSRDKAVAPPQKPHDTGYAANPNADKIVQLFQQLKNTVLSGSADRTAIMTQFMEVEHQLQIMNMQFKESEKSQQKLNVLYEIGKVINHILVEEELLKTIIDLALKVMNGDCGFIMLYDDKNNLVPRVSRKMQADEISQSGSTFSSTIAKQVVESNQSILTSDAKSDSRFQSGASIISNNIRSVICSPMRNKDQAVIGVIYVGSNVMTNVFSKSDVELLEAFANHAAISIENAKMHEERRRKEHLKSALERYVSKQIAERIMSNDGSSIRFMPERREVTLIFSDVRGFTTLSEKLSAEEMVEILNRYFSRMIDVIFKYGGTLDKFIGDSIMALFGAPATSGDDAWNAVQAAIEMQRGLEAFNDEQRQLGKPEIQVGIGINTGHVVVGNIGSDQRMEYTAIGDNVNLASRLQGKAAGGKIIISKATYDFVKDKVQATLLGTTEVKGKTIPVEIYEVVY